MRKLAILCLVMTIMSCKSSFFFGTEPVFTMGMSEADFNEQNKAQMVFATDQGTTIYRTYHAKTSYKFFTFENEKLVRFDSGTHPDDYKLSLIEWYQNKEENQ